MGFDETGGQRKIREVRDFSLLRHLRPYKRTSTGPSPSEIRFLKVREGSSVGNEVM